jgi:hypothetical protein
MERIKMRYEPRQKDIMDKIEELLHSCNTLLRHEPTIHQLAIDSILVAVEDMLKDDMECDAALVYQRGDVWVAEMGNWDRLVVYKLFTV